MRKGARTRRKPRPLCCTRNDCRSESHREFRLLSQEPTKTTLLCRGASQNLERGRVVNLRPEVVIVGAGPAGLATAIAASLKGLRTVVVDARKPPIDKSCGEGLLPHGAAALAALGLNLRPDVAIPFHGIRFLDEQSSACAEFKDSP